MTEKPRPRFYDDYHASYKAKHDPSKRENITAKTPCTFRDQNSDPGVVRAVTPKREAMWKNFSGSQAASLTGFAPTAHSGTFQPKLVPPSVAEQEAAASRVRSSNQNNNNNNNSRPTSPAAVAAPVRRNSGSSQVSASENNNTNTNNNNFSLRSNNNNRSSSSIMRSHNQMTYSQDALMDGAQRNLISGRAHDSPRNQSNVAFGRSVTPQPQARPSPARHGAPGGLDHHWTMNSASTRVVPVENNSALVPSEKRLDSIVRSAPFPHHKNMVFPEEDPSSAAESNTRDRLWMNRPLRNGEYTASRKRVYNVPTFRGSNDINTIYDSAPVTPRGGGGGTGSSTSETNFQQEYTSKVSASTGTSLLNNNNNNEQQQHFSKKKITVPTHLEGASATVTEEINIHRYIVRPQAPREFKAPYNEHREMLHDAPPEEVPKAARVLGKRHLGPSLPAGEIEQCDGGWSSQPVPRKTGPRFYPFNYGTSRDFALTDEPPKPEELPKFRPSVVPLQGAPAFVPSVSNRTNRASTPEPRQSNNSPGRRTQFTPRDHDIFGAKEQRQPWHHQENALSSINRQVELTAAPGSVDIKRCRGVGTYSPVRVQPQYRF
jgi:hypothetical protein